MLVLHACLCYMQAPFVLGNTHLICMSIHLAAWRVLCYMWLSMHSTGFQGIKYSAAEADSALQAGGIR